MATHPRRRSVTLGVRGVALFEATKGMVVILAGLGLFSMVHRNL